MIRKVAMGLLPEVQSGSKTQLCTTVTQRTSAKFDQKISNKETDQCTQWAVAGDEPLSSSKGLMPEFRSAGKWG